MNPKQFLQIGGVILLVLGILGYIMGDSRWFGDVLWFDASENIAHTVLGIVALLVAQYTKSETQKWVTIVVGVVALIFAVWGFLSAGKAEPNLGFTNLENPIDNVLHLGVGIWALYAALWAKKA